jgi:phosphate-induced protein 1
MRQNSLRLFLVVVFLTAAGLFNSARAQGPDGPQVVTAPVDQPTVLDRTIVKHRINTQDIGFAVTTGGTGVVTPAITNHGGPVIATPVVYVVWYGNWNQGNGSDNAAGQQIVRDFLSRIGGSAYFRLNTTYSTSSTTVTGNVTFGGETNDSYSRGSRLRDSDIRTIATNAINAGRLPFNANGVYFVLTSSDVSETSGFCSRYCGWHTAATTTAGHIRYSFVGNAFRCLNSCAAQTSGPNGNAGVDAMISVIAHELEEATSDPDLNAWFDSAGAENADKCAWTFGHAQFQTANGAWANMTLGSRNFLIQRNLQHRSNGDLCMMSSTQN